MATHHLRTWPEPFRAILAGNKHHEVRRSDRDFEVGDVLVLMEWDPDLQSDELDLFLLIPEADRDAAEDPRYTGHDVFVEVTYITRGGTFGLPEDLCIMSVKKLGSTSTKRSSTKRMALVNEPFVEDGPACLDCPHVQSLHEDGKACRICPCPQFRGV